MPLALTAGVTAALAALKAGSAATALKTTGSAIKAGSAAVKGARTANKAARAIKMAKMAKKAPKVTNRLQAAQAAIKDQGVRRAVGERVMEAAPEGLQKRVTGAQEKVQKAKDWRDDTFWDFEGGEEAQKKFQKRAVGNIQEQLQQPASDPEVDAYASEQAGYAQDVDELRRLQRGY